MTVQPNSQKNRWHLLLGQAGPLIAAMPPACFAMTMATGIVSIACHLLGFWFLAVPLFWLNLALYLILWLLTLARLALYPSQMFADLTSHTRGVGFFTMIAGTCILGTQFYLLLEAYTPAAWLWLLGIFLWLLFTYGVLAALIAKDDKPALAAGINGTWLVATVGTQSIAILGALLASRVPVHRAEMLFFALSMFLLGGMLYLVIMVMISYRFLFCRLEPEAFDPTFWINAGAAAISTLAGADILANGQGLPLIESTGPFLLGCTILFWACATWWIPLLAILEIWRYLIRGVKISYTSDYWGLVFPLGMYTVCTIRLAEIARLDFLWEISRYFIYLALTAWFLTFAGLVRSLLRPTTPGPGPA
ncbi:MAG: tellurite resistance/C4-dicarboxylate transporter family protein [Desulfobaccales bacterium]